MFMRQKEENKIADVCILLLLCSTGLTVNSSVSSSYAFITITTGPKKSRYDDNDRLHTFLQNSTVIKYDRPPDKRG